MSSKYYFDGENEKYDFSNELSGSSTSSDDEEDDPSQSLLPNEGMNFSDFTLLEDDDDTIDLDMDNESDM